MYAELVQKCLSCKKTGKVFYDYGHEKTCTDCMKKNRAVKYKENREKVLARVTKYRKENPAKIKHTKLQQTYGMSLDRYQEIFHEQNGVCAICERPETVIWKGLQTKLAVDHDHETGANRGLLCQKCNRALGLLEENKNTVIKLLAYIEKYKK